MNTGRYDDENLMDSNFELENVTRFALLVAYADGELHPSELEAAITTVQDAAMEFCENHEPFELLEIVTEIARSVSEMVAGLDYDSILNLVQEAAEAIIERDEQEIALRLALTVAYGDGEIETHEANSLNNIAQAWGISLTEVRK